MTRIASEFNDVLARCYLDWLIELGADEAISEEPINCYVLSREKSNQAMSSRLGSGITSKISNTGTASAPIDPIEVAATLAQDAQDMTALQSALATFNHYPDRQGARNLVFADGIIGAHIMIIGDVPSREDDDAGKSFSGAAGELLDNMLKSIGLSRSETVYMTNLMPWRPPNRPLRDEEISLFKPFLLRHIELANPEILVVMGRAGLKAIFGQKARSVHRGQWHQALNKQVLLMDHPALLLSEPLRKRDAWTDLLSLKSVLDCGLN